MCFAFGVYLLLVKLFICLADLYPSTACLTTCLTTCLTACLTKVKAKVLISAYGCKGKKKQKSNQRRSKKTNSVNCSNFLQFDFQILATLQFSIWQHQSAYNNTYKIHAYKMSTRRVGDVKSCHSILIKDLEKYLLVECFYV